MWSLHIRRRCLSSLGQSKCRCLVYSQPLGSEPTKMSSPEPQRSAEAPPRKLRKTGKGLGGQAKAEKEEPDYDPFAPFPEAEPEFEEAGGKESRVARRPVWVARVVLLGGPFGSLKVERYKEHVEPLALQESTSPEAPSGSGKAKAAARTGRGSIPKAAAKAAKGNNKAAEAAQTGRGSTIPKAAEKAAKGTTKAAKVREEGPAAPRKGKAAKEEGRVVPPPAKGAKEAEGRVVPPPKAAAVAKEAGAE